MTDDVTPASWSALAFRRSRHAAIIVGTDAAWTIIDVNDAYLAITHKERDALLGRPLFDAFPQSDHTADAKGEHNVEDSLVRALAGDTVVLPTQRYDLPAAGGEGFEEHHWEMSSSPIRLDDGRITALLHEVENVTLQVRTEAERARLATELETRNRLLEMQTAELEASNRLLQENAVELEAQAEELQSTAAHLEEQTLEAESARRGAESAERQLQTVLAQAPAAVGVTLGTEHRFILANRGYERLVGREVQPGSTFAEVFPELVEQGYAALLDQVYRTGVPYTASESHAFVDRGGPEKQEGWFDFVYQPLVDAHGKVIGVLQQGIDVTTGVRARHAEEAARLAAEIAFGKVSEAEQQIRLLADAIPTLAWTARADGYIDWYNRQWYEYTGTSSADMEGWGWQSVHHPAELPRVLAAFNHSIATGSPFEMVFPLRSAQGEYHRFLTRMVPLTDADGRVTRWFGTNTNVEALEEATQALDRAREVAESANRAKSEFLAVMSHELRTPLNAIGGYVELLQGGYRGPVTSEQLEDLARIRKSQRHLMALINDLLNFTRIEGGSLRMEIADIAVHEILSTCEALIAPQLRARELAFSIEACDPSLQVHADRERVQQIVLNLLTNAVKFTPPPGRVDVSCKPGGAGRVCIAIRDTGVGIPEDQLTRIFDPFIQVDARLTRTNDGIGLGLTISRDLARAMGGEVSVESTVGTGSTFTLELPRG